MKKETVKKPYYEMNDVEKKEYNADLKKKAKVIIKRILIGIFCVAVILLMIIGLLASMFSSK